MPKKAKKAAKKPKAKKAKGKKHRAESKVVRHTAPVARSSTISRNRPRFSGGQDRITVCHRELYGTITSVSTADWVPWTNEAINPGNSSMFPWLATVAWSWESYCFKRLKFIYEPRCATTQVGAVQMFIDYDAFDQAPISEQSASSFASFTETNAWSRATHSADPRAMQQGKKMRYVLPPGGLPPAIDGGYDITNYNSGSFYLYTAATGVATLGTLWIEYEVELYLPTAGISLSVAYGQGANASMTAGAGDYDQASDSKNLFTLDSSSLPSFMYDQLTQANLEQPSAFLQFNATTGEIKIPGPGIFSLGLTVRAQANGVGSYWSNLPAMEDILETASTGLEWLENLVYSGWTASQDVANYGAIFAVTGAYGILRVASDAVPWILHTSAPNVGVSRRNLSILVSFMSAYAANNPFLLAKRKKRDRRTDQRLLINGDYDVIEHKEAMEHKMGPKSAVGSAIVTPKTKPK